MLEQLLRVADQPHHLRPDQRAGDDIAQRRAELELAEQSDEDQRCAKHDRAAFEDRGGGLGRLRGRRHRADLDRRQERPEREQDRAMPRLARPRRRERGRRPASRRSSSCLARPASGSVRASPRTLRHGCARGCDVRRARPKPDRTRRRGPASKCGSTRRSSSSCTARTHAAAAGRRAKLRAPVLAIERMRLRERRGQPQDLGRVERRVHSFRHVVPPGPSSNTMPSALELVADTIGGREIAVFLGFGALGDAGFDRHPRPRRP